MGGLYLKGNPLVNATRHYRKKIIAQFPKLKFLDESPVFVPERARAEAFNAALNAGQGGSPIATRPRS